MFTLGHAFLFGVVEGVTEFLPISSTGHMILLAKMLSIPDTEFIKSFEIIIQLGAILAVVALYAKRLVINRARLWRLMAAFLPTAFLGLVLYKLVKHYLLGNSLVVVWSLLVGGMALLIFEYFYARNKRDKLSLEYLTYKHAMLIGVFQTLAIVPGVSRSAATIVAAVLLGYKREAAVEFSFLLAIPTMLAASVLDLYKSGGYFTVDQFGFLAAGFVTAFFVALVTIVWLLKFIKNHTFVGFGVYRIVLAMLFLVFVSKF